MKAKLIALNLALVTAIGAVAWEARLGWEEAQARRRANISVTTKAAPVPPLSPAPKPDAPPATKYAEVATKDLFSKDRNPTVVIEAPVVAPPKPMPALPVVYGVLGLPGGTRAIMAERSGAASKPVREGDKIGEFKIAALTTQKVTFEWEDKKIDKNIDDLIDRTSHAAAGGPAAPAPQAGGAAQPQAAGGTAPAAGQQAANNPPPPDPTQNGRPGAERGAPGHSQRACVPGDTAPVGTVVDGYRKISQQTMFGSVCMWVPAQ